MKRQFSASAFIIFVLFELLLNVRCENLDVCATATNIGSEKRSTSYVLNTVERPQCDESIVNDDWYRFGDSTAYKMPESCVDIYHCGSKAPIWLNGTHPTAQNPGPIKRQICGKKNKTGSCCDYKGEIQVKWCQNAATKKAYFVYQLKQPPNCDLSYCAGNKVKCNTNCSWNEITSTCSCPAYPFTKPPVLNQPVIFATKTVVDTRGAPFVATKFMVKCDLGYPQQQVDDGARFLVVLESNGVPIVNVTRRSIEPFVNFDEGYFYGRLGTNITCRVISYWESDNPQYSKPQVSNVLWFGLQPVTEKGEVIKSPVIKDGEVFAFKIRANFPITSAKCFEYPPDVACHPIYTFQIVADKNGRVCACRFLLSPLNNATDLITVSPAPIMGSRKKPFLWEIAFRNQSQEEESFGTIFQDYTIPSIMVQIKDSGTRPLCSTTGDPHVTTFPVSPSQKRRTYNIYLSGDFTLVSSTTRLFQVQVRQFPCTRTVSCNCAVMVREGNNILGIDSCQRGSGAKADWSPRLIRYLTDPEYPSGEIERTGSGWTISLLSGISIKVDRGYKSGVLDIHVIGLNSETYSGLCSYSGAQTGSCTSDCEKYRVKEEDSFFNYNSSNTPKCGEPYVVPTCDCYQGDDDNSINVTCSQPKQSNLLKTSFRCEPPPDQKSLTIPKPRADVNDTSFIDPDWLNKDKEPINKSGTFFVPVWPTPLKRINETYAKNVCSNALVSSKVYTLCSKQQETTAFGFIVDGCVLDIQLADDLSPVSSVQGQLERICVYDLESKIVVTNNGTDPTSEELEKELEKLNENICPSRCLNRGKCVNSLCVCDPGYIGSYCALTKGHVPVIKDIPSCTVSADNTNCEKIYVQTTDLLSGNNVSCKIKNPEGKVKFDSNSIVSGGVIICSLFFDTNPGTYAVSLSVDGLTYSDEKAYTIIHSGGVPCPDLTSIWDEMGQCINRIIFMQIKPRPLLSLSILSGPGPDLAILGDQLRQCMNSISERAKQGRK